MATPVHIDFSGYRVAIGGASRGIGRAMATAFAQAGANVSVCARQQDDLTQLKHELGTQGINIQTHVADLTSPPTISAWIENTTHEFGGLDILINNASGFRFGNEDADWQQMFQVDLLGAIRASRVALPWLKKSKQAGIIHTSSIGALHPSANGPSYGAIKAALNHYTESQALALADNNIRVNAIAPGSIEFPGGLWDTQKKQNPDHYAAILQKIPFGRYGKPEEVANVALFLASPLASWITGQIIGVDGGQILNG